MAAGRPAAARTVPGGTSRRYEGHATTAPATTSATPRNGLWSASPARMAAAPPATREDEDEHRRRQPAEQEARGEQQEADGEAGRGAQPVGRLPGDDDADHGAEEEGAEHPPVEADAPEVVLDARQDRRDGQRFERDERDGQ